MLPSTRWRARSPLRYRRCAASNGFGTNRSARQAEAPVITARQAGAGDVQLAGHPHRHRLQLAVEQVPAQVADRQADRACALPSRSARRIAR